MAIARPALPRDRTHVSCLVRSRVVWRTLHPGFKHSITGGVTHMLNNAIKANAHLMGPLEILDVGEITESLAMSTSIPAARIEKQVLATFSIPTAAYGTYDGRHLFPQIDLEIFNLILGLLWEAAGAAGTRGAPGTPVVSRQGQARKKEKVQKSG